jgi:hypothetical protein
VILSRGKTQAAGRHIGGGDEQRQFPAAAHRVEIDEPLDQVLERVDVEGIEIVGREIARHRIEPRLHGRAVERHEREQALDGLALDERQVAVD